MRLFSGLSAFPITPTHDNGAIDTDALGRLIDRLTQAKVDSIGLLGSTGTYAYLDRAARRTAIEATVARVRGATPVIVGIGALLTRDAVQFGRDAQHAGADGVLLAPVSYTPLTDDEVYTHITTVANAVDLPLCIYNNPGTTHFTFSPGLIARLAQTRNIVAVKNPSPEAAEVAAHVQALRAVVPPTFSLGYAADWKTLEALIAGGQAWYSVAAGLFPVPMLRIVRAVQAGQLEDARREHAALHPLWDLFQSLSGLRVMYAAAKVLGLSDLPPPRPILPLSADDERQVREVLHALKLN